MSETNKAPLVSICIATHNMKDLICETLWSCREQVYPNIEIIVYDDASTDGTSEKKLSLYDVKYFKGKKNLGVGAAFNEAIKHATGEFIVLMCADDLFTNKYVVFDIVCQFIRWPGCGVVARYYYQFIHGDPDRKPVRAWRTNNPVIQGNNPSGLAFRKIALDKLGCSNRMFIETAYLVKAVTVNLWGHCIIRYDTIAARVHGSTSTTPGYWLKRRVSSPVMDWYSIGGKSIARDYTSLIQIKNGFKVSAVVEEIFNFIKLRPLNLINPMFWFFSIVALVTPREILRKVPHWYRIYIGRKITKEIKRPCLT